MRSKNRFSVIEIIIALAVAAIIAVIAVPKFQSVLRKSGEGATKGGLGALRAAISMYYGDHEGEYPSKDIVKELTENGKYIKEIPYAYCPPHHKKSNAIITSDFESNNDTGGWAYKADDAEGRFRKGKRADLDKLHAYRFQRNGLEPVKAMIIQELYFIYPLFCFFNRFMSGQFCQCMHIQASAGLVHSKTAFRLPEM